MQEIEVLPFVEAGRSRAAKEVRVGIVGYGTVGRATAEILSGHGEEIRQRTDGISIRVTRACRRSADGTERTPDAIPLIPDWHKVVDADDVDIVVEAIGGTGVAYDVV